jgi:putative spermidine/putrescine transport system permease protein
MTRRPSPILLAITLAVTLFTVIPMLLSVTAGLINNYSVGVSSGFTTRWFVEVWSVYGDTVWRSLLLALCCVTGTLLIGVPQPMPSRAAVHGGCACSRNFSRCRSPSPGWRRRSR